MNAQLRSSLDDAALARTMDRINAYRDARHHDQILSTAADGDLRRLLAAPRDADTDFAVGWMCYCRYLSLGNAAAPGIEEALTRFLPFLPNLSEHLPRSIIALMRSNTDVGALPTSPLQQAAAQFLTGVEPHIATLPQARTREPYDALLAELANALRCLEGGDPKHNLALEYVAQVLRIRFETFGDPADLTSAIDAARDAMNRSRLDDMYVHTYVNTLSGTLCDRYELGHDPADLDEALAMSDLALRLTAAGHPDRRVLIHVRASIRGFQQSDSDSAEWQVEHAQLLREAVRAMPEGHERYVGVRGISPHIANIGWVSI